MDNVSPLNTKGLDAHSRESWQDLLSSSRGRIFTKKILAANASEVASLSVKVNHHLYLVIMSQIIAILHCWWYILVNAFGDYVNDRLTGFIINFYCFTCNTSIIGIFNFFSLLTCMKLHIGIDVWRKKIFS